MYGIFTYIYHILPLKTTIHVGKYTSPMDAMGHWDQCFFARFFLPKGEFLVAQRGGGRVNGVGGGNISK